MLIVSIAGISLLGLLIIGFILARMFVKASTELAFVRTGFGGKKVCKEGGMVVLPVMQQVTWVRLSTLKLTVQKKNEEDLITKDRMRVDVTAEFYMRVQPEKDSIGMAAQTLGNRTQDPKLLRELIEGKFIDGLRAVAMEMEMSELLEKRTDFVTNVQSKVKEDLKKNGLELETVSLTSLDQTGREYLNENNTFDAEGLAKLTKIVEERKKQRNDTEKDNSVLIEQKNLEAEKKILEIDREKKYAALEQERDITNRTATENASKSKIEAEQNKIANDARIESEREIKKATILASLALEEESIRKEQAIKKAEIEKERALEEAAIEKEKTVELANQERDILVAKKSEEKSLADKKANEARAEAVAAEEKVITARAKEIANRAKEITIIKAEEESGSQAAKVKVLAQAEKEAALDKAEAITTEARAKAGAIIIQAEADEKKYEVDAKGKEKLNQAENSLSEAIINMRVKLETIQQLPTIVEASVKPLEKIDTFKVINVTGLTGKGSGNKENVGGGSSQNLVDQLLQYRAHAPVIDNLLKEAGMGATLSDVVKNAAGFTEIKTEIPVESTKSEIEETIEKT